jgi:nucleotide-binding universal stress UspA family protein/predicted transcriptional regulator
MPQKLLVPLDGSDLGEAALPLAVNLARARNLELVLAQIIPWPTYVMADSVGGYVAPDVYEQIMSGEQDAANDYLAAISQRLASEGLSVETVVRQGTAAENLLDLADELGVFAIAMATHGRGGMQRLVFGSVAEQLIQQSTVPTLLVRVKDGVAVAPPPHGLRRLLVPLDGSGLAERALDAALELAAPATELLLLRVVPPVMEVISHVDVVTTAPDADGIGRLVADAQTYLDGIAAPLVASGRTVSTRTEVGNPSEAILQTGHAQDCDLVVMATHGHTGASRALLGSVADRVVRHAELPIFLVSARALAARAVGPRTVRELMTRDLATLRDDESIGAALRKLLRRRVSGAPVVDVDGELVGIISEHDLLEWQAAELERLTKDPGIDPQELARRLETESVGALMSHPAVTIESTASLAAALHLFLERRFRRLPVVEDGRVVGILSRSDVLKAMAQQWETLAARAT